MRKRSSVCRSTATSKTARSPSWSSGCGPPYREPRPTRGPQPRTGRTWSRLLDHPQFDLHGLVAVRSGRVVRICRYLFHPSTWSDAPCCYLEDLFVAADTRGVGAGQPLVEAVYAAAGAREAGRIH
ncbi:GNAT family N-acetyltransferase [Tepidamorphus gemmatus]|uniref:GNAT family N-acetyltransferase n=1 Tax=Tepidamorphus gemmatus TaxID=747076 RepID=UPI001048561A|nr:GNAT family N-acetyltransferase [Tepidamorphus gemmatus]